MSFHANQAYLPGGFTGVDIFFVISGYLITRIIATELESGQFSFTNFWIRRARRLLPALLFMLFMVTFVAIYVLLPDDLNYYGQLLAHTVVFAANIFLADEKGYFDPEGLDSPLLHVWSLAVEEQYYLVWPLLLTVALRFLKRRHVVAGVVVLCCISLAFSEWASITIPKLAFYSLPSRAFELLIGAGLALVNPRQIKSRILAGTLSLGGILLICLGMVLIDEKTRLPGIAALIPCFGAALIILSGGGATKTLVERLLSSSIFVRIGKISYSWYLWHWPPLAFTRYYFERPLSALEIAVALAVGLGMAIISWRYIESPFRKPAAPSEFRRGLLPVAICSSVALLGFGLAVQALDGLPSRMDKESLAMLDRFQKDAPPDCTDNRKIGKYGRECLFGKPDAAEPSIMLWGDSHARHYLPAIANIAAAQGIKGLARFRDACRPFIAPDGIKTSAKGRVCRQLNEEALAELSARPDISVVVLAARWSSRDVATADMDELAVFSQNLGKTIAALEQIGKKVVVLGQVPKLPLELKSCMTKQIRFSRKIPNCEAVPLSLFSSYETDLWTSMQALREKHSKATFFAPQNHLCNGSICRATDGQGHPLYRDDDHLSARGAYFLGPYINEAIGHLLRSFSPDIVQSELP